ncbi:unnamed protein product [Caretta caretta]
MSIFPAEALCGKKAAKSGPGRKRPCSTGSGDVFPQNGARKSGVGKQSLRQEEKEVSSRKMWFPRKGGF